MRMLTTQVQGWAECVRKVAEEAGFSSLSRAVGGYAGALAAVTWQLPSMETERNPIRLCAARKKGSLAFDSYWECAMALCARMALQPGFQAAVLVAQNDPEGSDPLFRDFVRDFHRSAYPIPEWWTVAGVWRTLVKRGILPFLPGRMPLLEQLKKPRRRASRKWLIPLMLQCHPNLDWKKPKPAPKGKGAGWNWNRLMEEKHRPLMLVKLDYWKAVALIQASGLSANAIMKQAGWGNPKKLQVALASAQAGIPVSQRTARKLAGALGVPAMEIMVELFQSRSKPVSETPESAPPPVSAPDTPAPSDSGAL